MRALTILLIGLAACAVPQAPETEMIVADGVAFASLGRGVQARMGTAEAIIMNAAEWTAFSDSLRPLTPFDSVRFDQEMVLLASLKVPASGYDLRFEFLERTPEALIAQYRVYVPHEDCRNRVGKSTVFHAIRAPRSTEPVRFVTERETLRCTKP